MAFLRVLCLSGRFRAPPVRSLRRLPSRDEQRLWGEQLYPRRGELYGQGQPVQPRADLHHRRGIILRQGEIRSYSPGPLHEEPDRPVLGEVL